MGGNPPQVPRFNYPGAEYFNLAPNRTIALENRQTQIVASTLTSIPASTVQSVIVNFVIDPNWGTSHAFYLVRGYALIVPNDALLKLQITSARMGIGQAPNNIFLDLGIPTATLVTPGFPQVVIYDRDALITNIDTGPNWPNNTPLSLIFQLSVNNLDGAAAHSLILTGQAVWHRLTGFVQ